MATQNETPFVNARNQLKDGVAAGAVALSVCTIYNISVSLVSTDAMAASLVWAGIFSVSQSLAVVLLTPRMYLLALASAVIGAVLASSLTMLGVLCLWSLLVAGYARMTIRHRGAGGPEAASMSFVELAKAPYTALAECLSVHMVPPDIISFMSVLAACPALYFGLRGDAPAVGLVILTSLAFDCLDGVSARRRAKEAGQRTTLRGQVVDIVCDKAASTLCLLAVVSLVSVPLFVFLAALSLWSLFRMVYPWAGGGIEVRVLCLLCLAFPGTQSYVLLGLFALATCYSTVVRTWKLRHGGGIHNWGWKAVEMRPLAYLFSSAFLLFVAVAVEHGGMQLAGTLQLALVLPAQPMAVRILGRASLRRMLADFFIDGVLVGAMTTAAYLLLAVGAPCWSLVAGLGFMLCSLCAGVLLWTIVRRTTTSNAGFGGQYSSADHGIDYRHVSSAWSPLFPVAFCSGPKTIVINGPLFYELPDDKKARVIEHERFHCRNNHFVLSMGMQAGIALLIPLLGDLLVGAFQAAGYVGSWTFGLFAVSMGTALVWLRTGLRAVLHRIEMHTNRSIE